MRPITPQITELALRIADDTCRSVLACDGVGVPGEAHTWALTDENGHEVHFVRDASDCLRLAVHYLTERGRADVVSNGDGLEAVRIYPDRFVSP